MIHHHQKQPLLLLLWFVLFSFSRSGASSFGTKPPRSFRMRIQPSPSSTVSLSLSKPLFIRGGSDMQSSSASVSAVDDSTSSTTSSSALSATADSSDATPPPSEEVTAPVSSSSISEVSEVSSPMGPNSSPPGVLRKLFPTFPWHTLPNLLTYARCIAIPALVLQFYTATSPQKNIHSSTIFAVASLTDYLDGYLARRWDICSPFGAFLDPVADKLMVSTALILGSGKYGSVVAVPSAVILAREIAVSALREWMASKGKRDSVKVGFQGKVKTAATMVALTIVLSVPDSVGLKWNLGQLLSVTSASMWMNVMSLGMVLLFVSSIVTVTSGSVYFRAAAPVLMGKED